MRELCPTCDWLESGEAHKQDIMCALHDNPDMKKYYCHCQYSAITGEEKREECRKSLKKEGMDEEEIEKTLEEYSRVFTDDKP